MLAPSNPFPQGSPVEGLPRNEKLQPQLLACRNVEDGESEEEYRVMADWRSAGKAQLEPGSGRLRRVNRKLCEMTGYSADELRDMTWQDLLDRQDGEQAAG